MRTLRQVEQEFRKLDAREGRINQFYEPEKLKVAHTSQVKQVGGIKRYKAQPFWDVLKNEEEKKRIKPIRQTATAPIPTSPSSRGRQRRQSVSGINTKHDHGGVAKDFTTVQMVQEPEKQYDLDRRKIMYNIGKLSDDARENVETDGPLSQNIENMVLNAIHAEYDYDSDRTPNTPSDEMPVSPMHNMPATRKSYEKMKQTTQQSYITPSRRSQTRETMIQGGFISEETPIVNDKYDTIEFYGFAVKIHKINDVEGGLFDVQITQDGNEKLKWELKGLETDDQNTIIFEKPNETTFSPAEKLPWVKQPRDLLGSSLEVVVYGTYPRRTKVATRVVKFEKDDEASDEEEDDEEDEDDDETPRVVQLRKQRAEVVKTPERTRRQAIDVSSAPTTTQKVTAPEHSSTGPVKPPSIPSTSRRELTHSNSIQPITQQHAAPAKTQPVQNNYVGEKKKLKVLKIEIDLNEEYDSPRSNSDSSEGSPIIPDRSFNYSTSPTPTSPTPRAFPKLVHQVSQSKIRSPPRTTVSMLSRTNSESIMLSGQQLANKKEELQKIRQAIQDSEI